MYTTATRTRSSGAVPSTSTLRSAICSQTASTTTIDDPKRPHRATPGGGTAAGGSVAGDGGASGTVGVSTTSTSSSVEKSTAGCTWMFL